MNIFIIYAEALAVNGNHKKAIDVLNNKIANTPDDYYLFQTKGNIYYLIEELDSATACYDNVIDMRPTYARPYVYEGEIYTIKGEKQKAIARYLEAIRLFEENDFIVETEYFCNRILDIDSSNVEAKKYLEQIQSRRKNLPLVGLPNFS
jgi:tetratricopeptide (TPR) repeat protein